MEAQKRQIDARLAEELIKQKARCEEELQLKLRSMQPALPSTPLELAAMQDMQLSFGSISHEPQVGTEHKEEDSKVVPPLEEQVTAFEPLSTNGGLLQEKEEDHLLQ